MQGIGAGSPAGMLGVVGAVILLAALVSGLVERSRLPQVVIFVAMGVVLGRLGLGVIDIDLASPALAVIATLGLLLVLFTDSVSVSIGELRRHARTAAIILGPGTLITAAVIAVADAETLVFAAIALFARGLILLPVIGAARLDRRSRWIVLWFGPRGLSSLLLVLLPLFAGVPGSERLFDVTALVVLCSIVVHGGSQMLVGAVTPAVTAPVVSTGAGTIPGSEVGARADRLSVEQLDELTRRGEPVFLLDVRTEPNYQGSTNRAAGAIRVPPDRATQTVSALGLPRHAWLVSYCA